MAIGVIGEDFQNHYYYTFSGNKSETFYDPLTGENKADPKPSNPFESFFNYNASKIIHLDSSIICAAGKGENTGNNCYDAN